MNVEYFGRPSYTMAVCQLAMDETVRVERGAMAMMSDSMSVSADTGPGGLVKGLMRRGLGGESLFMGRYTAQRHDSWVAVAPHLPGDITDIDLDPSRPAIIAESGALLAMSDTVDVDVKWAGARNIVLREGATMLRASGHGKVLFCTYGAFMEYPLGEGQQLVVDTGHLVAYEETVSMRVGPLSGLLTAGFSGEGFVAALTGPGLVYVQTRAEVELRNWLLPDRKQNR